MSKDLKEILEWFVFMFLIILGIPLVLLIFGLSTYILQSDGFQEWWVTIIWVLNIPITVILLMALKNAKSK